MVIAIELIELAYPLLPLFKAPIFNIKGDGGVLYIPIIDSINSPCVVQGRESDFH